MPWTYVYIDECLRTMIYVQALSTSVTFFDYTSIKLDPRCVVSIFFIFKENGVYFLR